MKLAGLVCHPCAAHAARGPARAPHAPRAPRAQAAVAAEPPPAQVGQRRGGATAAGAIDPQDYGRFVHFFRAASAYIEGHRGRTFVVLAPGEVRRPRCVAGACTRRGGRPTPARAARGQVTAQRHLLDSFLEDVVLLHGARPRPAPAGPLGASAAARLTRAPARRPRPRRAARPGPRRAAADRRGAGAAGHRAVLCGRVRGPAARRPPARPRAARAAERAPRAGTA